MVKLSELREILHKNKIRGYLHYDKKQLIVLLREEGLLPDEPPKPVKVKEEIDSKYEKLRTIRNNPKQVFLKSVETGGYDYIPLNLQSCTVYKSVSKNYYFLE